MLNISISQIDMDMIITFFGESYLKSPNDSSVREWKARP